MRKAGVIMPVASLPSAGPIGDLGASAYAFCDWAKRAGVGIWQILPLNPLGYGNSPYQPYSSLAGDEIYISLELLAEAGILEQPPKLSKTADNQIDYAAARAIKMPFLLAAFDYFKAHQEHPYFNGYADFEKEAWVAAYARFRMLKRKNQECCWLEWPDWQQKLCDLSKPLPNDWQTDLTFEIFLQYLFKKQWQALKSYANALGIEIMGDIPFYAGLDSADVWCHQDEFLLDSDGRPIFIAGVPPDYFSRTGQRWGNPIYDWEKMKTNGYAYWMERIGYNAQLFDIVRIDHFRAFDTYWKIPAACPTAIEGEWILGPAYDFFDHMLEVYPELKLVAEDLGDLRKEVYDLRNHYDFAGMKIVQFAFDPQETNNRFPDRENMVLYTGTHDNETIKGWFDRQDETVQTQTAKAVADAGCEEATVTDGLLHFTLASVASMAILPVQDVIGLGNEARLNTPGTIGSPNWEWRLDHMARLEERTEFLRTLVDKCERNK